MLFTPLRFFPACALFASVASAQVYIGDITLVVGPPPLGYDALVGLSMSISSAGGQGAASFGFESGGGATRIGTVNIAELYSLFIVPAGITFDAAYVSSHTAITDNSGTLPAYSLPYTGQQSVLFAYWDDRSAFGGAGSWGGIDSTDLYGWMRMDFSFDTSQGVVRWTLQDSATARGGIIAGTYSQVPEPASFAVLAGAAAITAGVATRRRHAQSAFVRS